MKLRNFIVLLLTILCMILTSPVFSETNIYDQIGIITEHGLHGAVPEENIDLFTGNLTLKFQDIRLPGPNGFDLILWRVYNSKLYEDYIPNAQLIKLKQYTKSWIGFGWSMHMGRLYLSDPTHPVIEFPDGRKEIAYTPYISGDNFAYTPNFLRYDKINKKLYFKDGTIWTFGAQGEVDGNLFQVVTLIENSFGHQISVEYYDTPYSGCMKKITDSMGRTILFTMADGRLTRVTVKNANGTSVYFDYTVETFGPFGYFKLTEFDPPEIDPCTFEYSDVSSLHYELTAMNTSYGARMEYTHANKTFYHSEYPVNTRVVTQKKIRFSSSDSFKTWNYVYPDYSSDSLSDTTVEVDGPEYDIEAVYNRYDASAPWKIGLLKSKTYSDGSFYEENEWDSFELDPTISYTLNVYMGSVKAPLQKKRIVTVKGDAGQGIEYVYSDSNLKKFGLPRQIKVYGGITGTTLLNYKTLEYYYEDHTDYKDRYMLDYIGDETIYSASGTKLGETETQFYTATGKYGAIDLIKRWRDSSNYLTWDYSYSSTAPSSITITIDQPGNAGIETHKYSYGIESEVSNPDYTLFTRTISQYDSSIKTETNQHEGTFSYSYDDLGRIESITTPSGFNNISASWSDNSVTITQGNNTVTKYWDGMGRDLGFTETGDGTTLYYRKILDAEGRIVSENKGSNSSSEIYSYQWNAAGNMTRVTDPRSKITNITYSNSSSGNYKTITDANSHATIFYYTQFPGKFTKLRDADSNETVYTYDSLGRLINVEIKNSREQSFTYNFFDQVTSENHPETGTITYSYGNDNNLSQKGWDSNYYTYSYYPSNLLKTTSNSNETITYSIDDNGRVNSISSTKGWTRDQIYYNVMGSITHERHTIPNLGDRIISYTYDTNNILKSITYPDGKIMDITNNGLNMPETLTFNSKQLISQVSYGKLKQPVSITLSGNSTTYTASYNEVGALSVASLKKGTTTLYGATYGYDNVGNISSLTNTTPSLNSTFSYDVLNRLSSASYTGGKSYSFEYDDWGNLLKAVENNITIFSSVSYNEKNQPQNSPYVYDNRGNLKDEPEYKYEWNLDNYLLNVKNASNTILSSHEYNERGLRFHSSRYPEPSITVLYPNGGEKILPGAVCVITWATQGIVESVLKIEYSIDNGQAWSTIAAAAPNTGSYNWTVPMGIESNQVLIRISESDGEPIDMSNSTFTISPGIAVTSPNGGEKWANGSSHNITWLTAGGVISDVKIDYSKDNGTTWLPIISSTANTGTYSWIIPTSVDSIQCLVRVCDTDGTPSDISDAVFYIGPTINIISPNGGEKWLPGVSNTINWITTGTVNNVKIEYSIDNGTSWTTIIASTSNTGSFNWTPLSTIESVLCLVRVSDIDGRPIDKSDSVFSLGPIITLTSPNGGEMWQQSSVHPITWTTTGTVSNVIIDYSIDNGANWTYITTMSNTGSYNWKVPTNIESDTCLMRVKKSGGVAFDTNDTFFSIHKYITVTLTSPNGGESWVAGSTQTIRWNSPKLSIPITIEFSDNNGATWSIIDSNAPDTGSYSWTLPLTISSQCLLKVTSGTDDNGLTDICDNTFSITAASSLCGRDWGVGADIGNVPLTAVNFGNSLFVTVGSNGAIYTGTNGYSWTNRANFPSIQFFGTSYGSNIYVAVGSNGAIVTSLNGIDSWQALTPIVNNTLRSICWGGDRFVAVGDNGTILTSFNGTNWTLQNSPVANSLLSVTYGYNRFVAVGTNGVLITSNDGIDWVSRFSDTNITLNAVAYGENQYIAVGNEGVITVSYDSNNWVGRKYPVSADLLGICHGLGEVRFVIVGKNGTILSGIEDLEGTEWALQSAGISEDLLAVVYGTVKYVAVGTGKTVNVVCTPPDPSIQLIAPNGVERLPVGSSYEILWNYKGTVGDTVKIEYSTTSGTTWRTIISPTPNTGRYMWVIPDMQSTTCLLRVKSIDGTISDISDNLFSIIPANEANSITVTSPNGGEVWTGGSVHSITWTSTGLIGTISIDYSIDGGLQWYVIIEEELNDGQFSWTLPLIASNSCRIRVRNSRLDSTIMDVSDNNFEIVYNSNMMNMENEFSIYRASGVFPEETGHGPFSTGINPISINSVKTDRRVNSTVKNVGLLQTVSLIDTYYIYAFDGKLLAEYDQTGACVKDYIYMGNRLLAEYQPQVNKYYYYMSDQINSTRIITDDTGTVIYSEAHGPYGDIQKTWNKTYEPKQKFSGKERETYSENDYFGARYYSKNIYRFISTDPIINRDEAISNPQLWNLYSYCRNNPITYFDPDGRDVILLLQSDINLAGISKIPMGHTAILIQNGDKWEYYSKNGKEKYLSGRDDNSHETFNSLEEFKDSKYWDKYDKAYYMSSSSKEDNRMIRTAEHLKNYKYSLLKGKDEKGRIIGINCADFTQIILLLGGKNVHPGKLTGATEPKDHFADVVNHNQGKQLK